MIRIRKNKTTRKKLTGPGEGKNGAEKSAPSNEESRDQFKGQQKDQPRTQFKSQPREQSRDQFKGQPRAQYKSQPETSPEGNSETSQGTSSKAALIKRENSHIPRKVPEIERKLRVSGPLPQKPLYLKKISKKEALYFLENLSELQKSSNRAMELQ